MSAEREGPVTRLTVRGAWPVKATLAPGSYTIELTIDGDVLKTMPLEVGTEPVVVPIAE